MTLFTHFAKKSRTKRHQEGKNADRPSVPPLPGSPFPVPSHRPLLSRFSLFSGLGEPERGARGHGVQRLPVHQVRHGRRRRSWQDLYAHLLHQQQVPHCNALLMRFLFFFHLYAQRLLAGKIQAFLGSLWIFLGFPCLPVHVISF